MIERSSYRILHIDVCPQEQELYDFRRQLVLEPETTPMAVLQVSFQSFGDREAGPGMLSVLGIEWRTACGGSQGGSMVP